MGNSLGGKKSTKVMKINGETMKFKKRTSAGEIVKDFPGHVLLESESVKHFGIRAKPLEPQQELRTNRLYFLVELPKLPEEKVPRRVRSGIQMTAKDRLESLMLARRSVSDLSMMKATNIVVEESRGSSRDGVTRLKMRLPKAEVEKLMMGSRDEAEAAEKIMNLFVSKEASNGGVVASTNAHQGALFHQQSLSKGDHGIVKSATKSREFIIMGSAVLVVFKFGEEKSLCPFEFFDSFQSIKNYVGEQWKELEDGRFEFVYTYGSYVRCKLVSESDFRTVRWLIGRDGNQDFEVTVINARSLCLPASVESSESVLQTESACVLNTIHSRELNAEQYFLQHKEKKLRSSDWVDGIKCIGQVFHGGVEEFRVLLAKYACEVGFSFVYSNNNSNKISAYCKKRKDNGCPWYVYASVEKSNNRLYLRSFINTHTCGWPDKLMTNHQLSSEVIKDVIVDEIRRQPSTTRKDVVNLMKLSYGYDITSKVAYTALLKAKASVIGDAGLSYNLIRSYFDKLKAADPSSQVLLQFDPIHHNFQRCHFAFGACLSGFKGCRPLLFLDGTFLKNKFRGHLLAAMAKDSEKGLFPVAFSIVQSEDSDNWLHFLTFLAPHIAGRELTFVSDRHGGIGSAISSVFPNAHHAFCMRHVKQNLKHKFKGGKGFKDVMLALLDKCAYAATPELFEECISEFKRVGGARAVQFLDNLPKEHYSNAYFKGKRYGETTSNASEAFNNQIRTERELPVAELIDKIRNLLMGQMYTRSLKAQKCITILSPVSKARYDKRFEFCRSWVVKQSSLYIFQVECDPIMIVDISKYSCSCFGWQIKGFPCSHAVAALEFARPETKFSYIDHYFHTSKLQETYSQSIPALSTFLEPNPTENDVVVCPPVCKRQPGRPRKNRIPSTGELDVSKRRCGRCHALGFHNRATCDKAL